MSVRLQIQHTVIELRENKQNIPEKLYKKLMDMLMKEYIADADAEDAEDEKFVECIKIMYRDDDIKDILLKYLKRLPYYNCYILIKERDVYDQEYDRIEIQEMIQDQVFDVLPLQALKDIIERLGGYEKAKYKISLHYTDKTYLEKLSKFPELVQHKIFASHLTKPLVEFECADVDSNSIDDEDVMELKTFRKILQQGTIDLVTKINNAENN